jgi:DNA-binding transcriptional ArsR family regulator
MANDDSLGILQIATVGEDIDPVVVGVREYPVRRLALLHEEETLDSAQELQSVLQPLKIDISLHEIGDDVLLDLLEKVHDIVDEEGPHYDDVYINVSSGRRIVSCAALSAAFVNGIKAFGIQDDRPRTMPVLKFSYEEVVSDTKFGILEALDGVGGSVESLGELTEEADVEKSLLSYHIRGGSDAKGLEELGLVEVDRGTQGRLLIELTPMGEMLLAGTR